MSNIIYSEAHQGDEREIAAFHRFDDPGLFTREYWSYRAQDSVFALGRHDGRIVATEALMPYELSVCGTRMLTGRSERTLVDPAHRGGSVWRDIMRYCAERGRVRGMDFIWGSTGARRAFENAGFTFLSGHRLHLYASVSLRGVAAYTAAMNAGGAFRLSRLRDRVSGARARELEEYAVLAAAVPSAALGGIRRLAGSFKRPGCEISDQAPGDSAIEDLYRRLGVHEHDIYLPQSDAFFQWLLSRSKIDCTRYFAYRQDRLAGYACVSRGARRTATIFDFAFEDGAAASALIGQVRADLREREFAFIKISLNIRNRVQKGYLAAAVANGFIPLHRGGSHVVMPLLHSGQRILNDMSRWYLTDLMYLL